MGSSFSILSYKSPSADQRQGLGDLPESCLALVLVHLDPPQICKMSMMNRAFKNASSADFVWESKLPLNYTDVVEAVFGEEGKEHNNNNGRRGVIRSRECLCKRDVFARLCGVNSLDGGKKKVWLDKSTGKICMSISSNGLAITGIDDRRYWSRIPTEESRFSSIAYLQQTWWFEVDGEIEFPFPPGSYSLFFRLQLGRPHKRFGRRVCNLEHIHGWEKKPVRFQLSTSDGQQATKQCYLKEPGKWIYYHAGDFNVVVNTTTTTTTNNSFRKSMKVKFSMTQIDCTHTKGGLCVDSAVIYPTEYKERFQHF